MNLGQILIVIFVSVGGIVFWCWVLYKRDQKKNEIPRALARYRCAFHRVPVAIVKDIEEMLVDSSKNLVSVGNPALIPDNLAYMIQAAGEAIERKESAKEKITLSREKKNAIIDLNSEYKRQNKVLVTAYIVALGFKDQAGLGFGLITNSAANAALYTLMDKQIRENKYRTDVRVQENKINVLMDEYAEKLEAITK